MSTKFCPFCKEDLIAYDDVLDLYLCSYKHYQIYFYGSKNAAGQEEYQEQILFDGFYLTIEHPEEVYELKIDVSFQISMFYELTPFDIGTDYEKLKSKLETYITFL